MTVLRLFLSAGLLLASLGWPVSHEPEGQSASFARGERLSRQHDYKGAVEAYTEAVRLNPRDVGAFLARSQAYKELDQAALARQDIELAVQADPASDEALLSRATDRYFDEHYADALKDLDAAIRLNPDRLELYHLRACAHSELGQLEPALADFTHVIEHDPDKTAYGGVDYDNRARVERGLGRPAEALADYDRAEAVGSSNPLGRGECLLDMKRYREALEVFDHILDGLNDDPGSNDARSAALYDRALARVGLKAYDLARSDIDATIALKPDDARTYGNASWARLLAHQDVEARVAALQGLVLDDKQEWIRLNLAHVYLIEGRIDRAKRVYLQGDDTPFQEGKTRAEAVREDFAALREVGIDLPAMAAIESLLPKPAGAPGNGPKIDVQAVYFTVSASLKPAAGEAHTTDEPLPDQEMP